MLLCILQDIKLVIRDVLFAIVLWKLDILDHVMGQMQCRLLVHMVTEGQLIATTHQILVELLIAAFFIS